MSKFFLSTFLEHPWSPPPYFFLSLFLFLGFVWMGSKIIQKKTPPKKKTGLLKISPSSDTFEGVSAKPYPDVFTLSIGSVVNLDGIMLLSGSDGWIRDYTVETSRDGVSWNLSATVERSSVVLRFIRFDNGPLSVKQLRVIITAAMAGYSRISELSPVYAVSNSTTNPLGTSNSSPSTATTTTTVMTTPPPSPSLSPVTSRTKSNTVGIVAGVLGGLAGILLGVLAYFLWLLRKQRNDDIGFGDEGAGQAVAVGDLQKSPVSGNLSHTNFASELRGQDPGAVGGYPRTELA